MSKIEINKYIADIRQGYKPNVSKAGSYYSIALYPEDIEKMARSYPQYASTPTGYSRIRQTRYEEGKILIALEKRKPVKTAYKPGDQIVFLKYWNIGSPRYPYRIVAIGTSYIRKITNQFVFTLDNDRIPKEQIIGRTKQTESSKKWVKTELKRGY